MRMFQKKKIVDKFKTHTLCSITCFPKNLAVYEIMYKIMVEPDRSRVTVNAQDGAYAFHDVLLLLQIHAFRICNA
jgi:hypothetical protein